MKVAGLNSLSRSLRMAIQRQSPFTQVDASGDLQSASRQMPIILGCQAIRMLLFAVSSYLLTRLIAPQEFGRLLMVSVPIAIASLVGDLGLGDGVVRSKEMDPALASFFFWINLATGAVAACLLLVFTPFFEQWFGVAQLLDLAGAFAVVIVLGSCTAQYRSLLRRQLRLESLSLGELGVTLASSVSSIAAAEAGLGASSVPLGRGVGHLVDLAFLIQMSGWIPGRVSAYSRARSVLSFGWRLSLAGVFHFGMIATSHLLLGRYYGPESLGFLERAFELSRGYVGRFDHVIRRVSFPLLARRVLSDPEGGRRLASKLIRVSIFIWPVPVCLLAASMPAFAEVLFGTEWRGLGGFLGWAWFGLVLWLPLSMAGALLLACGHSSTLVYLNIVQFFVQMGVVVAGIWFGLDAYICLWGIFGVIVGCWQIAVVGRRCGADWHGWLGLVFAFLALGGGLAGLVLAVVRSLCSPLGTVAIGGCLILVWLAFVCWRSPELKSVGRVFVGGLRRAN